MIALGLSHPPGEHPLDLGVGIQSEEGEPASEDVAVLVRKAPPVLLEVHGRWTSRAPTAAVNEGIQAAQSERSAPGGARYRYGTQVGVGPPTFVLFTSGQLEPGYLRFLRRRLREEFGFRGTPIHLEVRAREKRGRK